MHLAGIERLRYITETNRRLYESDEFQTTLDSFQIEHLFIYASLFTGPSGLTNSHVHQP